MTGGRFPTDTSWERAEAREAAERALATPSLHPLDPTFKDQARALLIRVR